MHQVVTGTAGLADEYSRVLGIPREKVRVVPNDLDPAAFAAPSAAAAPAPAPVVLYVGRLSRPKGAHLLPSIFAGIHREAPDATFVVAGGGPEEEDVRRRLEDALPGDRVRMLGYVPNREVAALMRCADVLVMPSLEEGFPRRVLEAMACGVPFVTADVGGTREVVAPGAAELLHAPGDAEAAAASALRLLADPDLRSRLADEGHRHVEKFSVQGVAPLFFRTMVPAEGHPAAGGSIPA